MATAKVPRPSDAVQIGTLLGSPEIAALVSKLEATRWTGRPGYPIRSMVGMTLAKAIYALPTWTRTVALVREHAGLRLALGCGDEYDVPSIDACYRFTRRVRTFNGLLSDCIDHVISSLGSHMPAFGPGCSHRRVRHARLR